MGAFSDELLKVVVPKKLHLVDPWQSLIGDTYDRCWYESQTQEYMDSLYEMVNERFVTEINSGQVEIHRQPSTAFLEQQPDDSLDWVYIDADHSYDAVRRDLEWSFKKVRSGGLIAGDDYRIASWWKDAIVKAVDEFCVSNPVEMVLDSNGQFVILKK